MELIKLDFDKISYHNTENINIVLDIQDSNIETSNLTNININIYKLDEKRNEFTYGFGSSPKLEKNKFNISQKLSESLKGGIYFIRHIKLVYGNIEKGDNCVKSLLPKRDFELKFFHIRNTEGCEPLTSTDIEKKIGVISKKRQVYRTEPILAYKEQDDISLKSYRVLIFGIGCLIHNVQELNGYTIYPINTGLDYSNMNNPVNDFISKHLRFNIPYNNKINKEFKSSAPLFVIDYLTVKSKDFSNAFLSCNAISQTIFSILANQNGQRPDLFAYIVIDCETNKYNFNFQFPGYQGNIVSDFSPTKTANEIDKLLPILSTDPWLKFVFDSHSFALNETNIDLKYFRLWAILELIAKKEITENNIKIVNAGNEYIQDDKGDITKTKYALAKVYYFVYKLNLMQTSSSSSIVGSEYSYMFEMNKTLNCPEGTEKIILWDSLSAMYAIRNATAHKGKFILEEAMNGNPKDKLAAKYYPIGFNMLLNQLESIVRKAIDNQIDKHNN
jgi:hypothetical protein